MQDPKELINESIKEAKIGDYVLQITNKVIKDKKMVLSVLSHLKKSVSLSVKAFMIGEKMKGKTHNVFLSDELLINYFIEHSFGKSLLSGEEITDLMTVFNSMKSYDLRGMILEKNDKYMFISDNYEIINVRFDELKRFTKIALDLAKKVEENL
ncbi:MAG: hypothetical protein PHT91_02290 [Candidatus Nanoarchaeia archaeon]|nr:hypothetical protein [Candidatus Nanoarchaeia archaeon]MDD5054168.1 hypothetical protein [Candidatus Nanoarchaeia archaeon]MDD5499683.1 hypothetical protein [Candidatus Nanoarchaeia archaeon]